MDNITGGSSGCLELKTPTTNADPSVAAVAVKFPQNLYSQEEVIGALTDFAGPEFRRFALSSGVASRHTALPLSQYKQLNGFTEANDDFVEVALDLAEQALLTALDEAKIEPSEVDVVFSTTVTGLAVPSLEARLATRVGLRQDVKRVPLFGLGCVAGAAGLARVHDYLRAFPDQVAVLLAVELCSLTIQREDNSIANLVASSLFGDGAARRHRDRSRPDDRSGRRCWPPAAGPTRTPKTCWAGTSAATGFRSSCPPRSATVVEKYLGDDVRNFLADHGLTTADVSTWCLHAAGPKVIDAVENALELPADALEHTEPRCATTEICRRFRYWIFSTPQWPTRRRRVRSG